MIVILFFLFLFFNFLKSHVRMLLDKKCKLSIFKIFLCSFILNSLVFVYVYVCVCINTHIHTHTHTHIYIYIYTIFVLNELFLVIKKAHKYKIIQTLSSSNFIYSVRYMIIFFMIYLYWTFIFYSKLTHLAQKLKNFD